MTDTTEPRAVVSWGGLGEPIMLECYGPDGEVALPLTPTRALALAQELIEPAVTALSASSRLIPSRDSLCAGLSSCVKSPVLLNPLDPQSANAVRRDRLLPVEEFLD